MKKRFLRGIFAFVAVLGGVCLSEPACANAAGEKEITVTMPLAVEMSLDLSDKNRPAFYGEGEVYSVCEEQYKHTVIAWEIQGYPTINTPNGEYSTPAGTIIGITGCMNSRSGYRNYQAENSLGGYTMDDFLKGKIYVKIPISKAFIDTYGMGEYSMVIPVNLTMETGYGEYDDKLSYTSWEALIEMGDLVMADDTTVETLPANRTDGKRRMILEIPPGITTIKNSSGMAAYSEATIPASLTGEDVFYWSQLEKLTFEAGRTSIPKQFCEGMHFLEEVVIEDDEELLIDSGAFSDCTYLKSINMPKRVTLGAKAFANCYSLEEITFRESVDITSDVTSYNYSPFHMCDVKKMTFEEGITSIPSNLCCMTERLTDLYLPTTLTTMGYRAFTSCHALKDVTIRSNITISGSSYKGAFENTGIETITFDDGVTYVTERLFYDGSSNVKHIYFPETMKAIGADAFNSCESLEELYIPSSITYMGGDAFKGCEKLKELVIRSDISLPRSTVVSPFRGSGITKITYTGNATSIPAYFFKGGCEHLTDLDLGNVTFLDGDAFGGCTSLKHVEIKRNVNSDRSCVRSPFSGGSFESITIDEGVTLLSKYLFADVCSNITEIHLPSTLMVIEQGVFEGCTSLETINFPASLRSVGQYAFKGSTALKYITINSDFSKDGSAAISPFYNGGLETITIADGVTRIGRIYLANATDDPMTITIPTSVTTIDTNAFLTGELFDVVYTGTRAQWNDVSIGYNFTPLSVVCADDNINTSGMSVTSPGTMNIDALLGDLSEDNAIEKADDIEDNNEDEAGDSVTTGSFTFLNAVVDVSIPIEGSDETIETDGEEVTDNDRRSEQSDDGICNISGQSDGDDTQGSDEGLSSLTQTGEQDQAQDCSAGTADPEEASGEQSGTDIDCDIG